MNFLDSYQACSSQKLNVKKSSLLVSSKLATFRISMFQNVIGFGRGTLPFSYLGCTIFKGISKQVYYDGLVQKIQNRVEGWRSKLLSLGGKLILIKQVLSSIPIHNLSVFDVPAIVLDRIDRLFAIFLWGDQEVSQKRHWISWEAISTTVAEGGLSIRKLSDVTLSLRMKFAWRVQQQESLWATFMSAKHGVLADDLSLVKGTSRWKNLQKAWLLMKDNVTWSVGRGNVSFWFDN